MLYLLTVCTSLPPHSFQNVCISDPQRQSLQEPCAHSPACNSINDLLATTKPSCNTPTLDRAIIIAWQSHDMQSHRPRGCTRGLLALYCVCRLCYGAEAVDVRYVLYDVQCLSAVRMVSL